MSTEQHAAVQARYRLTPKGLNAELRARITRGEHPRDAIAGRWPVDLFHDPAVPLDEITLVVLREGQWVSRFGVDDGTEHTARAWVLFDSDAVRGGLIVEGPDGWELRQLLWGDTYVDAAGFDLLDHDTRLSVGTLVREIVERR